MTHSEGVPAWARPVLEALVELAYAPLDNEQTAAAWNRIGEACDAALVSDAGTPERERCPYCSFAPESLSDYCDKHRPTFFAPAPDAELDRLLTDFGALMWDRGRGRAIVPNDIPQRKAIHAHVERVKREARAGRMRDMDVPTLHKRPKPESAPAPSPGDASGETDPFRYSENRRIDSNPLTMQCSKLCQLIEEFPASPQQTACIEEANRLLNGLLNQHLETQQLRAAAGEVVATAWFRHRPDRIISMSDVRLTDPDAFTDTDGYEVQIVRRDKEGT